MKRVCIALDFDKTLVTHESNWGISKIGEPVKYIVELVKHWINDKKYEVVIFTARVCPYDPNGSIRSEEDIEIQKDKIRNFLKSVGLPELEITCLKFPKFTHFIDDRAWHVKPNTGVIDVGIFKTL